MGIPLLDTILGIVKEPLDRLVPDKKAQQAFQHELEMEILRAGYGQVEVNKAEAEHASLFVAGWRPFVGWICGGALAWQFIGYDMLNWLRLAFFPDMPAPPALTGSETLVTVLLSLLGLGGLRTVEKIKGVSREAWPRKP